MHAVPIGRRQKISKARRLATSMPNNANSKPALQ